MASIREKFEELLGRFVPDEAPFKLLACVSGGADSVCLVHLLAECGIPFAIAHCNFHLRGEESDGDEIFVKALAEKLGAEFLKADFNTREYALAKGISIEMAARDLRYEFFAQAVQKAACSAVAVAHNQNDNAETLMLNLLRGSGISGLCGMKAVSTLPIQGSEVPLLRPLLNVSRKEIQEYLNVKHQPWREDSSNAENEYRRNRLRNSIFPLFEELNPACLDAFSRDMTNLRQVEAIADDYFGDMAPQVFDGERIDVQKLGNIKHREYVLYRLMSAQGASPAEVKSVCNAVENDSFRNGNIYPSGTWEYVYSHGFLVRRSPAEDESLLISGVGEYESQSFRIKLEFCGPEVSLRPEDRSIFADAAALPFPFIVRHWKSGDWMVPFGMRGRKKLSDIFSNMHLSIPEKEKAVVVEGTPEGRIAAILDYSKIDDSVKVGGKTKSVLKITLLPVLEEGREYDA